MQNSGSRKSIMYRELKVGVVCLVLIPLACQQSDGEGEETQPARAPVARTGEMPGDSLSTRAVMILAWLEGNWAGTTGAGSRVYERYALTADSTIIGRVYSDSTLTVVTDSVRIYASKGRIFVQRTAGRWVATSVNQSRADFLPLTRTFGKLSLERTGDSGWRRIVIGAGGIPAPLTTVFIARKQ
jgi:hypothetical protein